MSRMAVLHFLRSRSQCRHRFFTNSHCSSFSSVYHCFRSSTCGRSFSANPNNANLTRKTCSYSQIRWASQGQATPTEEEDNITSSSIGPAGGVQRDKETEVVYHGPTSSRIKELKLLSLCACCLSVYCVSASLVLVTFFAPNMEDLILLVSSFFGFAPDMEDVILLVFSTFLLASSVTAILNWWIFSPYIHKLRWVPGYDRFEVEMLTWLAIRIRKTIKFADIRPPGTTNRPFVTFKANGQFYFVETGHFHNKALLAELISRCQ